MIIHDVFNPRIELARDRNDRSKPKICTRRGSCRPSPDGNQHCNLFVLGHGIAASRNVPLFNPINNRRYLTPNAFEGARAERRWTTPTKYYVLPLKLLRNSS
ncbi:hypothetical protein KPH14_003528 [Odynerus spinipes]|uniref:Uncharacterized protein n=1 Tax=Odynerus spinipes TaxID=1348599 RepID=A0AAD9RCY9_9HYME|nr:hypothetical protein KPH14_003528 [Odynerus spinipes]